jgi:hypothetical protein
MAYHQIEQFWELLALIKQQIYKVLMGNFDISNIEKFTLLSTKLKLIKCKPFSK